MNIIQAREAAMAGKTVISPNGVELVHYGFGDMEMISREWVFGKWKIKIEPVVFEVRVIHSVIEEGVGLIANKNLYQFCNKRVKVSVEVIDEP